MEGGGAAGSSATPSKILADERTNTLILLAERAGYLRVKALVKRLDVPLDVEGAGSIHVYPLENADAEEMATTLNSASCSGVQQPSRPAGHAPAAADPRHQRRRRTPGRRRRQRGAAFEGQVRVTHDKPTNSLVVVASVQGLPRAQRGDPQARRAAATGLHRGDRSSRSSIDNEPRARHQLARRRCRSTAAAASCSAASSTPNLSSTQPQPRWPARPASSAACSARRSRSPRSLLGHQHPVVRVLFQALATTSNTNVLSSPHILTTDNEEAEISVGQNIPYQAALRSAASACRRRAAPAGCPARSSQNSSARTLDAQPQDHAAHQRVGHGAARDRARDQRHRRRRTSPASARPGPSARSRTRSWSATSRHRDRRPDLRTR